MNKILYSLFFCCLVWGLTGCDQDIDYPYEGKDRIQFQHYTVDYNGTRHYNDSTVFSFGLSPDSISVDTLKLVMEYLGAGSDQERIYHIVVDTDSTNAIAGTHYKLIEHEQIFRPSKLTDTLRIIIFREHLPNDYTMTENIRLDLKVENSKDFDLGLRGGLRKKILLNNYMSEPGWWQQNFRGALGFFHPKKWKILIEVLSPEFATYGSFPYDNNSPEGQSYAKSLDWYLIKNVVIDDKTGMRIKMHGLESVE